MQPSQRLFQLDAMRGIAALMVVVYHFTTHYGELYTHPGGAPFLFNAGHYGVQFFFLISGFVIHRTLIRTTDVRQFAISRIARLYPPYWVAVALTSAIVGIFGLPGREVSLSDAFINLSMIQSWFGIRHVDGVYWTLTLELSFYVLMALVFLSGRLGSIPAIGGVWILVATIYGIVEKIAPGLTPWPLKLALLLDNGNLFLAGIIFSLIHRQGRSTFPMTLLLSCIGLEFLIHGPKSGLVAITFMLFFHFSLADQRLGKLLNNKFLLFLGSISYSLYLVHQNIGFVLIQLLYKRGFDPLLAFTLTMLSVIALAYALERIVETPGRTWMLKLLRKESGPAAIRA